MRVEIGPHEALLQCVYRAARQVAWLRLKVESLGTEELLQRGAHGAHGLHTWARLEQGAIDRLAKLSKIALATPGRPTGLAGARQ